MSHLLQMRGLKPELQNTLSNFCSRIFYRCVDWNKHLYAEGREGYLRRIFYRCVDWNKLSKKSNLPLLCRIFYRCVDWNLFWHRKSLKQKVASFTDAWIETIRFLTYHRLNGSHLLQMRGLKLLQASVKFNTHSRIFYRCVDWNFFGRKFTKTDHVASFTDAWIETNLLWSYAEKPIVASFTDAWIETKGNTIDVFTFPSHLLQMRGLKQLTKAQAEYTSESHLLQMRGLKQLLKTELFKSWGRIFYRCVDWNFCTYSY